MACEPTVLDHASPQPLPDHSPSGERAEHRHQVIVGDLVERPGQVRVQHPTPVRGSALDDVEHCLDRIVAAAAGPKSVGPRFKPRFPLGLQCVRDPGLLDPVHDHRDPQWSLLAACLRDEHAPDRLGLERLGQMLHPPDHL